MGAGVDVGATGTVGVGANVSATDGVGCLLSELPALCEATFRWARKYSDVVSDYMTYIHPMTFSHPMAPDSSSATSRLFATSKFNMTPQRWPFRRLLEHSGSRLLAPKSQLCPASPPPNARPPLRAGIRLLLAIAARSRPFSLDG
eukprot:jgi/Tetstr1/466176/TSEL_010736.t1